MTRPQAFCCAKTAFSVALLIGGLCPLAGAADPLRAALELRERYAADIEQLAAWCESNDLADEARQTRRVLGPTAPDKLYVPILPIEGGPRKLPADASEKQMEWNARLGRLRRDYAATLFDIARRAVRNGRAGLAFELAVAASHADPDFEPVRRLFGQQKFRDQWRTAYEIKKLRTGHVWSDRFGWIHKSHLPRYEQGQRWFDGRWISAEEDARRHRDIRAGWEVETEHYAIQTNHSIEAGVALGVKLERLHRLWQQLFIRFFATESDVGALFDGRQKNTNEARRRIVYFRDRDDYNRAMRPTMPNVEQTTGVYRSHPPCAYFFAGPEGDDRTLYHEATHQLFHESRPPVADMGRKANFWIIEGAALYMETLREEDGFFVLGGFDDLRLRAARYRLIHDDFYIPLEQFTAMGIEKFQNDSRLPTLYSQSAGLTNFLVHYDGGRYRDALVLYLVAVYAGLDQPDTLAKLTGVRYSELDRQYRKFIAGGGGKAEGVK